MSEPVDPVSALIGMAQRAAEGMSRTEAIMAEASRPPRYEYARVEWDDVNRWARQGWQLVPIYPLPMLDGHVFIMQRQLGAADEAADMLRKEGS